MVDDLDMNVGTNGMTCCCASCEYLYEPCGYVLTGNLNTIKDRKLRNLIKKGPKYREQNNINWDINSKNCRKAVSRYAKNMSFDE